MKSSFKSLNKKILFILLAFTSIFIASCSRNNKNSQKINFASYKTANPVPYDIYFEESYFDNPASEYNSHLASASACLALAGFSSIANTDYEKTDTNIHYFFDTLGFDKYQCNAYGISKPTPDSFGVYIASKKINDYTLIGIGVRGAGYQSEWASNFKLGNNPDFAQGFFEASEIYLNFLKEYINSNEIKGKIKIWTSGYSRGGATVNIAAGRIDDGLIKNENILSNNVTYTKDDIYAYSFEPPAGKICKLDNNEIFEKGENYSNIYSILNLNDVVPFVAPFNFNFIRYGNDLFLPDIITTIDYKDHINRVKNRMSKLANSNDAGEYLIDTVVDESTFKIFNSPSKYTNFSLYVYLNKFIDKLCEKIGSKEEYVDKLQYPLTELFSLLYSNSTPKDSLITLAINIASKIVAVDLNQIVLFDLQNNRSKLLDDLNIIFHSAIKSLGLNLDSKDTATFIKTILSVFVEILLSNEGFQTLRPFINVKNIKAIGSAHIPELLLSHITSLDDYYEGGNLSKLTSSFNKLVIKTDKNFELIINNQRYAWFNNNILESKLACIKDNDGYTIYLPADLEFKINSDDNNLNYYLYNHNNKYLNETLIKSQ